MCEPMTIMGALAAGSAAMGGVAAARQADAQQAAENYNAQVAANNAAIAGYQRSAVLQQGQAEAEQAQMHQSQMLGEQRAALAANGVAADSGSALDQLATTRFLGGQDVATIQSNAARQAWGYALQGANDAAQSNLDKWRADNINPAGIGAMAAGGSLLSSASMFAANNAKRVGGWFGG